MFDAVHTGRMMLKRRGERTTFNSVKHIVENMTKREFRVEHLAQMKALRPESFDWQYVRVPVANRPAQLELQLLLTFDRPTASGAEGSAGGSGSGVGRYGVAGAEQQEFRAALAAYAREHPLDPETGCGAHLPTAPLPPRPTTSASTTPSRSASLPLGSTLGLQSAFSLPLGGGAGAPSSPGRSQGGVSGGLRGASSCPAGALPQVLPSPSSASRDGPSTSAAATPSPARSLSRTSPATGPGAAAAAGAGAAGGRAAARPGLTPIPEGTPTRHHTSARTPLEGDGAGAEEGAAAGAAAASERTAGAGSSGGAAGASGSVGVGVGGWLGGAVAASTPQSSLRPAPSQQGTPSSADPRLARLHSLLSPAAMQRIREAEAAAAAQTPEAKRHADTRRAVSLLPTAHDLLRHLFGNSGPVIRPLAQVVQAMSERSTQRLSTRDAANALALIARAAPEFVRIDEPKLLGDGSMRPKSVAVTRSANAAAVAARLRALAADPDAAVVSLLSGGAAAVVPAAAGASPSAGGAAADVVGEVLREQLRPRVLVLEGEEGQAGAGGEAGSGAGGAGGAGGQGGAQQQEALPQPPPSARKRPPGLPLAPPPSPGHALRAGRDTPTRSRALVASGLQPPASLLSPPRRGPAGAGPQETPTKAPAARGAARSPGGEGGTAAGPPAGLAAAAASGPSGAHAPCGAAASGSSAGLLQQLLQHRPVPSPAGKGGPLGAAGAGAAPGGAGALQDGLAAVASPGRGGPPAGLLSPRRPGAAGRTPGRTAVQEAMLGSGKRSSSRLGGRRQLLLEGDDAAGVGAGGEEQLPQPRRLEALLGGEEP